MRVAEIAVIVTVLCAYVVLLRPGGWARGWGLLLPLIALCYAETILSLPGSESSLPPVTPAELASGVLPVSGPAPAWLAVCAVLAAGAVVLAGSVLPWFRPGRAAQVVPAALLCYGLAGLVIGWRYFGKLSYHAPRIFYGAFPGGVNLAMNQLVLLEVVLFLLAGGWLARRTKPPGAGQLTAGLRWLAAGRGRGTGRWHGLLLLLPAGYALGLLGFRHWFGLGSPGPALSVPLDAAILAGAGVLMARSPLRAATLAVPGLLVTGGYGIAQARFGIAVPGQWYGPQHLSDASLLHGGVGAHADCAVQGVLLIALALWLAPRVAGEHRRRSPASYREQNEWLTQRVRTLSRTRAEAVDGAAAELRRIERDLHDGAQARLVALGMNLRAAERLFPDQPDAALALVGEAKEAASRALAELRDLVRGVCPPVLADRGLPDALRALALDTPVRTETDIGRDAGADLPVAAAVYFAVTELLTNVVRHSGASVARIALSRDRELLRVQVADDGVGGADPARGSGMAGIERRLAPFDGILAVSSPPGGPTIAVIEVPCALS